MLLTLWVCAQPLSNVWLFVTPRTDCRPPGSSVYGIFQARTLEWVATYYSRESSRPWNQTSVSCVSCIGSRFFTTEPPGKLYLYLSYIYAAAAAKSLQSCLTLCNPIDSSPQGSPIPGVLQARTLEWVAISFSNAWKWKVKVKSLSHVRLLAAPWTAAYQTPPSMGFSRQEYWSWVPLPSPGLQSRGSQRVRRYWNAYSHAESFSAGAL